MRSPCLIIFPPVWEIGAPYLAGPTLVAYLRSLGVPATQFDANLVFWRHFKGSRGARAIHDACRKLSTSSELAIDEAVAARSVAQMQTDAFERWFTASPLNSPIYRLLVRRFGGFYRRPPNVGTGTIDYHDGYFSDVSHSFAAFDSALLYEYLKDSNSNPWIDFASRYVVPRIDDERPSVLAISIVAPNQVVPALTIALLARSTYPELPIALGGSWVTQLRDRLHAVPWFSAAKLFLVPFQGEAFLRALTRSARAGVPLPVPFTSKPTHFPTTHVPFDDVPTPEFDGLDLGGYADPGHLPLMASRGCYWGKCKFCSYPILEPQFEARSDKRITEDIKSVVLQNGARHIAFVDPSLSVPLASRIGTIVDSLGLNVTWGGFARLEHRFTRDVLLNLSRRGCSVIHWGLESGSQKMQDKICKGISIETARRVLADAAAVGIHNRVLMMYGLPDETDQDLSASLAFIEDHLPTIGSVCWSHYAAEEGTPFGNDLLAIGAPERSSTSLAFATRVESTHSSSFLTSAIARMSELSARTARKDRPKLPPPLPDYIRPSPAHEAER
jgi:hypothetical protein